VTESDKAFVVFNKLTNKKYEVKKESLATTDWENINSVLSGREPIILDGITRIVGYFSKISNWNKSKVGELHDRREGNYTVDCGCNK
jgi:anaerobic ribonucleoside-triphosphate reductase